MIHSGIPGADGIAIGEIYIYKQEEAKIDRNLVSIDKVQGEVEKLHKGIELTKSQILKIRDKALAQMREEEAAIFNAHIMFLEDRSFVGEMTEIITREQKTAACAADMVVEQYASLFETLEDEYLRERASDIKDVGKRLIRNILGFTSNGLDHLTKEVILVASDLTPSDTISLNTDSVKGLVIGKGGRTSHAAIIARTIEIPAVLGLGDIVDQVRNGEEIVIDGVAGIVIVNPTADQLAEYRRKLEDYEAARSELKSIANLPAITSDGRRIEILGNIGIPQDIEAVLKNGGEGVGLYRTEFLYMGKEQFPSEEEQFIAYKTVAQTLKGRPVTIRTLDIGGDKELKCFALQQEANPFLGWRAIRISLAMRETFKTQLRAILRASAHGKVLIMYPMISGIQEVREANAVLLEAKNELRQQGTPFDENIKVGIMVEVPSAALTADTIVKEVDFFSIGTNDLCQYTLAVDRTNEKIAHMYNPLHPAVLRLIKNVIDAAHKHGKLVALCGELAGDPLATVILLGLGLDELSMNASSMPQIKKNIRNLSYHDAQRVAEIALDMETPEAIAKYLAQMFEEIYETSYKKSSTSS